MASPPAPSFTPGQRLVVHKAPVREEWIDYNGHMNVAYYVLAFDHAADAFYSGLGLTDEYRERHGVSTFALESHVCYLRELKAGERMRFEVQLLDLDEKRFHYVNLMYREPDETDAGKREPGSGELAATGEWISGHMDMTARRMAPFRDDIREQFEALLAAHRELPVPEQVGRVIGIRRKGRGAGPVGSR